ncbi:hypothetical protein P9133_32055 [Bacillus thuringiensis]|uniref:Uncharacterized protein n=1 Tax=Bacillus thuringiensis HD-771 TaxID=1218175 RepID=A0A9W3J5F2_BACTU|nr:hypothetical protein [Bacillus thuringiensis]AFQ14626.1 hypothetical protein BTG_05670 [Bacillus thuringiensis HD-771]MEC3268953.1 hypothetical protein [Bacillus thuringiensis]MEC3515429.1 hypothetical protein [Bacillus thuringiensis]MED2072286.1 hypothetical protein [Bacillus thuringiensis]MED2223621.1 hypothetical protein [Bacillus thuringiensis]
MTLNNVAFVKHQERFEQMSIYDFIEDSEKTLRDYEKSQEVQPSETVPQVDEAQESEKLPSSDLDTRAPNTLDIETYKAIVEECEEAFQPTEDTDSTLFSVGDVLTVRKADEVYSFEENPEDHSAVERFEGLKVEIVGHEGESFECNILNDRTISDQSIVLFYPKELQKI